MRNSVKYAVTGIVALVIGANLWLWKADGETRYPETALTFTGVGLIAIALALVEAYSTSEDRFKDAP